MAGKRSDTQRRNSDRTGADSLPTREEISPTGGLDLDERYALEHFLGITREEVAKLIAEKRLTYSEDLVHMGPVAFDYYFPAYAAYIYSPESSQDSGSVQMLQFMVEQRLEADEIGTAKPAILECLTYCIEHFGKFEDECEIATQKNYARRRQRRLERLISLRGEIEALP